MSSPDLFPDAVGDSPKAAWFKQHGIKTHDRGAGDLGEGDATGERILRWTCEGVRGHTGYGDTEDEALADWARRNRVRFWNERGVTLPRRERSKLP